MKKLIIYHGNCIDGFTAAWCCWKAYGPDAEFVPGIYGEPPPDVTGRDVLIVDFSYPRDVLVDMKWKAADLHVLDHHKTAQADLEGLSYCTFDMNRSGAKMAEDWLGLGEQPIVSYVQDRDLWRFELHRSREVNAFIGSLEQRFEEWSRANVMMQTPHGMERVVDQGEALLRAVDRYCREMAKQARICILAGYQVLTVNAPYINTSELVGYLASQDNDSFAVGWFQRGDGKYQYSLRSRSTFDVSAVAKQFGGGGHRNAAGFTVDKPVHA